MMTARMFLLAAAMLAALPVAGQARQDVAYGSAPEWGRYKQLAEAALRAKLPEPERWTIEWPYAPQQGKWRHKGTYHGYLTCGRVRSDVPIDGRALMQFLVVIDHDQVQIADIGQKDPKTSVNYWCGLMTSQGLLKPAEQVEPAGDVTIANLGLIIRAMPTGAYVVSTVDDGNADRAKILPGMVLVRANDIALAGMGAAMGKLLQSPVSQWRFETATGDAFTLEVAP